MLDSDSYDLNDKVNDFAKKMGIDVDNIPKIKLTKKDGEFTYVNLIALAEDSDNFTICHELVHYKRNHHLQTGLLHAAVSTILLAGYTNYKDLSPYVFLTYYYVGVTISGGILRYLHEKEADITACKYLTKEDLHVGINKFIAADITDTAANNEINNHSFYLRWLIKLVRLVNYRFHPSHVSRANTLKEYYYSNFPFEIIHIKTNEESNQQSFDLSLEESIMIRTMIKNSNKEDYFRRLDTIEIFDNKIVIHLENDTAPYNIKETGLLIDYIKFNQSDVLKEIMEDILSQPNRLIFHLKMNVGGDNGISLEELIESQINVWKISFPDHAWDKYQIIKSVDDKGINKMIVPKK
jgi:hypothetical protein